MYACLCVSFSHCAMLTGVLYVAVLKYLARTNLVDANARSDTRTRVGYDIYDPKDIIHFEASFPKTHTQLTCNGTTPFPHRGYVHLYVPSFSRWSEVKGVRVARAGGAELLDDLIHEFMFLVLRKEEAYTYGVSVQPVHSVLFPQLGYYHLSWIVGPTYKVRFVCPFDCLIIASRISSFFFFFCRDTWRSPTCR